MFYAPMGRFQLESKLELPLFSYVVLIDSLHYARNCSTYLFLAEAKALKMMRMASKSFC